MAEVVEADLVVVVVSGGGIDQFSSTQYDVPEMMLQVVARDGFYFI